MESLDKPVLTELTTGNVLKIFKATGKAGMIMPEHHSTQEVAITVQKGSAVLKIDSTDYLLKEQDVFIIPEGKIHTLHLKEDFQAIVIMPVTSQIKFG